MSELQRLRDMTGPELAAWAAEHAPGCTGTIPSAIPAEATHVCWIPDDQA